MRDTETDQPASSEITDVCLLIGRDQIADWKVRAFERMTAETGAEITLVVRAHRPDGGHTPSSGGPFKKLLAPILEPLRSRVAEDPKRSTPLSGVPYLSDVDRIDTDLIPVGTNRFELPADTVRHIASETDLVIQFGVGILQGDILTAPRHGVLGYHLADVREYRGSYVTLWMFLDRVDRGGVTLQRLTEDLDAGEIVLIDEVDLTETKSWPAVLTRLYETAVAMLPVAVERLQDSQSEPQRFREAELGKMYRRSDVTTGVKIRLLFETLRRHLL